MVTVPRTPKFIYDWKLHYQCDLQTSIIAKVFGAQDSVVIMW